MNIRKTTWYIIVISSLPTTVIAEVSDKVASIPENLTLGFFIGGGLFLLGRFRWWLNILLMPIPVLMIDENISFWNEIVIRNSLLHEQGLIYFCVLIIQSILLVFGLIIGIFCGYTKSLNKI